MTTPTDAALSQLRHLYQNMVNGGVRDTASAKRIAEGLLSPAIAQLENAIDKWGQPQAVAGGEPVGDVVVTKNDAGHIVAVTRQDEEGRVLSVIATSAPIYTVEVMRAIQSMYAGESLAIAPPLQAVREPTSEEILAEIAHEVLDNELAAQCDFKTGWRWAERHHGITKGGQHGAP